MLYSKIHKKISLGEYSSLRKKRKENHFNLGNLEKNTWGLKQKNGEYIIKGFGKVMLMVIQA